MAKTIAPSASVKVSKAAAAPPKGAKAAKEAETKAAAKAPAAKVAKKAAMKSAVPEPPSSDEDGPVGTAPWNLVKETQAVLKEDGITLSREQLKTICDTFINLAVAQVREGRSVCFRGNFTIKRVLRQKRVHRDPRPDADGEEIVKPAHYAIGIEMKPALKQSLAEREIDEVDVARLKGEEESDDEESDDE